MPTYIRTKDSTDPDAAFTVSQNGIRRPHVEPENVLLEEIYDVKIREFQIIAPV